MQGRGRLTGLAIGPDQSDELFAVLRIGRDLVGDERRVRIGPAGAVFHHRHARAGDMFRHLGDQLRLTRRVAILGEHPAHGVQFVIGEGGQRRQKGQHHAEAGVDALGDAHGGQHGGGSSLQIREAV
jgi:hypothetical protein